MLSAVCTKYGFEYVQASAMENENLEKMFEIVAESAWNLHESNSVEMRED